MSTNLRLGIVGAIYLAVYASLARVLFDHDFFLYSVSAREWLHGCALYGACWQDKPPVALFLYLVPELFGRYDYVAAMVLLFSLYAAAAWMAVRLLEPDRSRRPLDVALVLAVPLFAAEGMWLSTEAMGNALLFPVFALFLRSLFTPTPLARAEIIAAGALIGVSAMVRQNLSLVALPMLALLLWRRTPPRLVLAFVAAAAAGVIVPLVAAVPFVDVKGLIYAVLIYPLKYAQARDLFAGPSDELGFVSSPLAWLFAAAFIAAFSALRGRQRWLLVAMAATLVAAVLAPAKPYSHYWVTTIPFSALALIVAAARAPRFQQPLRILMLVAAAAWSAHAYVRNVVDNPLRASTARALGDAVAALPDAHNSIYAMGGYASAVYYFSGSTPDLKYFMDFELDNYQVNIVPDAAARVIASVARFRPDVIVLNVNDRLSGEDWPSRQIVRDWFERGAYGECFTIGWYRAFSRSCVP